MQVSGVENLSIAEKRALIRKVLFAGNGRRNTLFPAPNSKKRRKFFLYLACRWIRGLGPQRAEDAATALVGYQPSADTNENDQLLRRTERMFADLRASLKRYFSNHGLGADLHFTLLLPLNEKKGYQLAYTPRKWVASQLNPRLVIGLALSEGSDWFARQLIAGCNLACQERIDKYELIVTTFKDDIEEEQHVLGRMSNLVAGMIVIPYDTSASSFCIELNKTCNLVIVDRPLSFRLPQAGIVRVSSDEMQGGRDATAYLFSLGCKTVYVACANQCEWFADRIEGWKKAHLELKKPVDIRWIISADERFEQAGIEVVQKLRSKGFLRPGIGIFAVYDMVAYGVRTELDRMTRDNEFAEGFDIPVVGFDGRPFGQLLNPKMPTIKQDFVKIGEEATKLLIGMIEGRIENLSQHHKVPVTLLTGNKPDSL